MVASGIRVGTPAITTRGMREAGDGSRSASSSRACWRRPTTSAALATREGGSRGPVPEVPAVPRSVGADRRRRRARSPTAARCRARSTASRRARRSVEMAAAVADVFADGGILLAEAGTGTGKTLAYLVPAILSRERVLVSTGTKNLQEQIFFKDLPVAAATRWAIPFTAAYMKGRGNYLCLHRFDALQDGAAGIRSRDERDRDRAHRRVGARDRDRRPRRDGRPAGRLAALDRHRGDQRELHRRRLSALRRLLRHARCASAPPSPTSSSSTITCCAPTPSVRQSAFGEVIPVVPLRHRRRGAPARGRRHAVLRHGGQQLSRRRLRPRRRPRDLDEADPRPRLRPTTFATTIDDVRDGARLFFGTLQMLRFEATTVELRAASASTRADARTAPLTMPRALVRGARGGRSDDRAHQGRVRGCRSRSARRAAELKRDVQFLTRADDPGYVYYLEIRGRGVFLRASPIDVVRHHPRDAARPDDGDGAHVGDAQRGRLVRLRPRPARRPPGARSAAAVGVRLHASRRSSICRRRCPTRGRRSSSARPDARWSRS